MVLHPRRRPQTRETFPIGSLNRKHYYKTCNSTELKKIIENDQTPLGR